MKKEAMKFTDSAVELFKEVYEISGGAVVVEELPEVGEPNTLYELRENKPVSYDWVAMVTHQMGRDGVAFDNNYILIFDTYEQMTSTINNLDTENISVQAFMAYLRNEDKLYGADLREGPDSPTWQYTEVSKISAYNFAIRENPLYILTSYEGYDEVDDCYKGTLPNGVSVNLYQGQDLAFILYQVTFNGMEFFISNNVTVHPVTILPTAQELVANYLDELVVSEGYLEVEIDGVVTYNEPRGSNYRWVQELENFYQPWEEGAEPTEIYTGELEWNSYGDPTLDTIPYQELFEMSEEAFWYFKPWKGGEKISYWIYTNDEWVDIDDIGKPNYFSVYIKSYHFGGLSNIPLDEVSFYLGEKELQLIKLTNDGEQEFGCLLVPITANYDNAYSVTMRLTDEALSLLGGDSNLFIDPIFVSYEDPISVGLLPSVNEYDFELLLGTLVLSNGNMM